MGIGKSIEKAIKVINSCKTPEQFKVAEKYLELLIKKIDNKKN